MRRSCRRRRTSSCATRFDRRACRWRPLATSCGCSAKSAAEHVQENGARMKMRTILAFLSASLALGTLGAFAGTARAEIKTQEIEYKAGDTPLKGFLAYDDAQKGKRPGVLVVHEWWGMNEHARNQA